jgi:mitogen-activated protein kinase kinase 1/mitogen-activated protein kinase kinase
MDSPAGLKKKRNFKELKLQAGGSSSSLNTQKKATTEVDSLANNISKLALENDLVKVGLVASDFDELGELGHGNGGAVKKVFHVPSNRTMARKVLYIDRGGNKILEVEVENLKKQVVRELQILHTCHSEYIVSFYGAFIHEGEIFICMEYMDLGYACFRIRRGLVSSNVPVVRSLDYVYHKLGKMEEDVLGRITSAVLEGLIYLYHKHRIIHRGTLSYPSHALLLGISKHLSAVGSTFIGFTSGYFRCETQQYLIECRRSR